MIIQLRYSGVRFVGCTVPLPTHQLYDNVFGHNQTTSIKEILNTTSYIHM